MVIASQFPVYLTTSLCFRLQTHSILT